MGHIVFAQPSISSYHLHERLRRDLLRRGHRVTVLCAERCRFTFWREQVGGVDCLVPTRPDPAGLPSEALLDELPGDPRDPVDRHRLQRLWPAVRRWFERERPDLVLLHSERGATSALLQFAARAVGSRVLWTGEGLLPHTMQTDERGLDGDAASRRWSASDYRVVAPQPKLLDACLANALARTEPLALPRAEITVPPVGRRLADAMAYLLAGRLQLSLAAPGAWRHAFPPPVAAGPTEPRLDLEPPFVAVLLQANLDPRVRLDARDPPTHASLVRQAFAAADAIDAAASVVVVLPPGAAPTPARRHRLGRADEHRLHLLPASTGAVVAAAAAVTITVNHPLATVALLASTPVVHIGRALYELAGVTTRCTIGEVPASAVATQRTNRTALRRRFLTWLLQHGHVWCSPTHPNHNGILGLVQSIERRLATAADDARLPYVAGPTWPLTAR